MIIATLDRFGYELRVLSDSKKMAEKCLIEEYKKGYYNYNHCKPDKEELDCAKDEIFIDEIELNEVHWV
jgi:hypothetical protein